MPARISTLNVLFMMLPVIVSTGCLNVPEASSEYDSPVDVVALVASDTMQAHRTYTVQLSFIHQCGQTAAYMKRTVGTNRVTLIPMTHISNPSNCPAVITYDSITDTVSFSSDTTCIILVQGRTAGLSKLVSVVPTYPPSNIYSLHYRLQSIQDGSYKSDLLTSFTFLDRTPLTPLSIITDSLGIWDTTFVDSLQKVRYEIAGVQFTAVRGIKDDGYILTQ